jgi:hypothetical protein
MLLITLLGCPDPGLPTPAPSDGSSYTASLGDDPDFTKPESVLRARWWLEWGSGELTGYFGDAVPMEFHQESERIGNCRLMTYAPSTCDPDCTGTDMCVDGACVAYPVYSDRGDVLWTWPDGETTASPNGELLTYSVGVDASSEGETRIEVDGQVLDAPVNGPVVPDGDWGEQISRRGSGQDVTLRWDNPVENARVRVRMTDCTGSHGGFADAEIECEGPDTGALTLPGPFLDTLDAGAWGRGECGSHNFDRFHAAAPQDEPTFRFESVAPYGMFYRPDW